MGSNFDKFEPDGGVVLEEKGRAKRGQANSQVIGKLSRSDYQQRFSKTMFNFSMDQSHSQNQNSSVAQGYNS